ncbi:MAG TPA: GNAT family N-acetyltransferase [Propionibacteriaceae bacterium]|nr:GNAT family N-acetyltransferase [Propionibacteriaceae bacterium]
MTQPTPHRQDPDGMSVTTHDNPSEHRYEIYDGDELAGFATYRLSGPRIAFIHTEVLPAFADRKLARQLVADALDDARRRGLAVLPFCPYVRRSIARHPEQYLDLVPESERERFGLAGSTAPPTEATP